MVQHLQNWVQENGLRLSERNITCSIKAPSRESNKLGISASFTTDRGEATVELWETGESDFHFLDSRSSDVGVRVTHYEFSNMQELYDALENLLKALTSLR